VGTAAGFHSPVVTAAMTAAAAATGMEVVFIGGLTADNFTFQRLHGTWSGLAEGLHFDRADSFCARLLEGAPTATADAAAEPAYRSVSAIATYGVTSYVGVPIRDEAGQAIGTLCAIDHCAVPVDDTAVAILLSLADLIAAHLHVAPAAGVVIRRTPCGWQVDDSSGSSGWGTAEGEGVEPEPDLTTALTLADLLADGNPMGNRPPRGDPTLDVVGQLRLSVAQLEHALAVRVVVEQAIGVLAERQRLAPRVAFERLRKAARSRGRKVHSVAREVVASAHASGVPLPPELGGRRS